MDITVIFTALDTLKECGVEMNMPMQLFLFYKCRSYEIRGIDAIEKEYRKITGNSCRKYLEGQTSLPNYYDWLEKVYSTEFIQATDNEIKERLIDYLVR